MTYTVTNKNLIACSGGKTATTGHRLHLAIYKGEDGLEYIYLQKRFQLVSTLGLKSNIRETVTRS
jgi:hypothetical protein